MDDMLEISLLLDFYGNLLTKKQFDTIDLHYNNDYSLGEISQQFNISRQGVFDNLKRGKVMLFDLEEKLGLVKRFEQQRKKAEEVLGYINKIEDEQLNDTNLKLFEKIRLGINDIVMSQEK